MWTVCQEETQIVVSPIMHAQITLDATVAEEDVMMMIAAIAAEQQEFRVPQTRTDQPEHF